MLRAALFGGALGNLGQTRGQLVGELVGNGRRQRAQHMQHYRLATPLEQSVELGDGAGHPDVRCSLCGGACSR